ncbi:PREDICTED: serine/threonine-kinase [Prunus dulcis]|uniref:PREDICTED: serine/threonine-kinase n=1 Tax=Prunus dulcis TaxID=3755 RepID=A0A5E4EDX4_PRUDU|nr:serine/threonine-protein kinase MPS1 isoform X2 [Prunus dulcis]VVA13662.1 PREDICTED: serine/threonine-kinase [Prunus dulcis]
MDGEANLPVRPAGARNLIRPTNLDSTSSSSSSFSSSFSSSSSPHLLRNVQAAFKRHRPLGVMQSNSIKPRRMVVPQRGASKSSASSVAPLIDTKKSREVASMSEGNAAKDSTVQPNNMPTVVKETQEDACITPFSSSGASTQTFDEHLNPFDGRIDQIKPGGKDNNQMCPVNFESQLIDGKKKVQFSKGSIATPLEMEWVSSSQAEASAVINHDSKHQNIQNTESDISLKSDGGISSSLAKRTTAIHDQLHQFKNFLSQPVTQSSVVGPSCATTTSVHATSAPMLSSTTYCTHLHSDSHVAVEPSGDFNINPQPVTQGKMIKPSNASLKDSSGMSTDHIAVAVQTSTAAIDTQMQVKEYDLSKEQKGCMLKETKIMENPSLLDAKSIEGKGFTGDATNPQSQAPLPQNSCTDMKLESSKSEKQQKAASGKGASAPRKRNYDPDLFFKVNGKLYQRLGKIGSGGSSEVHKVISSDCTIYALKKIKLKGRDYATAFGFCQEIEYLDRLKGKNHIIQLIDYEVTDKALLREVLSGSMSNKDGRVKDDGYIYMVLEYGEIDLAHMLSQQWKEMDVSKKTIDENWLRFYWQQILLAVNTIHEERIVHSDLKPANFLLVKGSLKLIDFGIAKAIMSDTTNIQRDSQVGTLSYMSPEAFMCNESDADGNTIKCGRPSDIWSLGCILYQMVYGRTPFADYKTFWAKFKVITDPNHEITYAPVSNPWLLDLMKKCLAWDRNERWRIPQLLQHPFIVPPVPNQPSLPHDENCKLLQLIAQTCDNDSEASKLCCQIQQLLKDPVPSIGSQLITSRDQHCKLLSQMSRLCFQLQEHLISNSEG